MDNCFLPADILLPKTQDMQRWSVIACDQFTSDLDYWRAVRSFVGDAFSTLHMILPEAELESATQEAYNRCGEYMKKSIENGSFTTYQNAFVYVERTLLNGDIRTGIVGKVDLTAYEYDPEKAAPICATEQTVLERIPPRMAVRENACIEYPHVIMLCNDFERQLIESISAIKDTLPKLYDFMLMQDGGHIAGWLVAGKDAEFFMQKLEQYIKTQNDTYAGQNHALFAVGDGNHSLVTAKCCYEKALAQGVIDENAPARFALVELENIHSPAQAFEPIHRVITEVDTQKLLEDMKAICADDGCKVEWIAGKQRGTINLNVPKGQLAVTVMQEFLDAWLAKNSGKIDYIHDEDSLEKLAQAENTLGLLLPAINKRGLFEYCSSGRVFPRKTFSMGHGREKRYYLEGRIIK